MKGKKIGTSVLAAVMLAGTTAMPALAAMPTSSVVIGEKAFALNYANDAENIAQIREALTGNTDKIFVKFNNKWFNNDGSNLADTSVIPAVAYVTADGEVNYEAGDGEEATEGFEIVDISATGVKKITAVFSEAVEDTDKVDFTVKKGKNARTYESITWNDEKTEAVIELYTSITAGDYTVEVKGLDLEVATKEFTAENEKVVSIEILDEKTPVSDEFDGTVTVNYTKLNQYGEETSKGTEYIQATLSKVSSGNGVAKFTVPTDTFKSPLVEEYTYVVSIVVDNTVQKQATLKAVPQAKITEATIGDVYTTIDKKVADLEPGTITEKAEDQSVYVKLDLVDQYGNVLDKDFFGAITANSDVEDRATLGGMTVQTNSGMTYKYVYNTTDTKDKSLYLELTGEFDAQLPQNLLVIVGTKIDQTTIAVNEASNVDQVNIVLPEIVAFGEENAIEEFEAFDQTGEAITGEDLAAVLNDATIVKVTDGFGSIKATYDAEDETVSAVWDLTGTDKDETKDAWAFLTIQTETNKITNQQVQIKAAAYPVSIALNNDVTMKMLPGTSNTIKLSHMTAFDQYGREMSYTAVAASEKIELAYEGADLGTGTDTTTSGKADKAWTFAAKAEETTTTATIKLTVGDNTEESTFALETIDQADVVSIEVTCPELLYVGDQIAGTTYGDDFAVVGLTKNGEKVKLAASHYSVQKPEYMAITDGALYATTAQTSTELGDDLEGEAVILVIPVLGHNVATVTETVAITAVDPKLDSIAMVDDKTVIFVEDTDLTVADVKAAIEVLDQYGVEFTTNPTNILISDIEKVSGSAMDVADNGSKDAEVTAIAKGDTFKVKVFYGSKTVEFTVKKVK